MLTSLPNLLTYSRIAAIPAVVGFMSMDLPIARWVALGLYASACITDFFDGYLARAWSQQSALGTFLDPIADKLLVASVLLMAVSIGTLSGFSVYAALIILCREILVSGLREFLSEIRVSVPVTQLAKWKTAIQMLALGFLITGEIGPNFGTYSTTEIGVVGIWVAALLTAITGADYLIAGLRHLTSNSKNNS